MADQIQIGGTTLQTDVGQNPMGSALAGVATGADWAVKNYEIQAQKQQMEAQAQKLRLEAMKNQFAIGQELYGRMKRIAMLPPGDAKKNEIDLLGADMNQIGMQLHPSAVALMNDKELGKNLMQVLNSLDSRDPNEKVNAISSLPYLLSSDKITDVYLKRMQQLNSNQRAYMQALATASDKQAGRALQEKIVQAHEEGANSRQEKLLTSEEKRAQMQADAKALEAKNQRTAEIRKEVYERSRDLNRADAAAEMIYALGRKNLSGPADIQMIKAFNQFNDSPRVTDGEVQMQLTGAALVQRVVGQLKNWTEGTKLPPVSRKQIIEATKTMQAAINKVEQDRLQPHYNEALQLGLVPERIFTPKQMKLLNQDSEPPAVPPGQEPAAPPAGTRASKVRKPAVPATGATTTTTTTQTPPPGGGSQAVALQPKDIQIGKAMMTLVQQGKATVDQVLQIYRQKFNRDLTDAEKRQIGIPIGGK